MAAPANGQEVAGGTILPPSKQSAAIKPRRCYSDALTDLEPTFTAESWRNRSATDFAKTCKTSWRAAMYGRYNPNVMFLLPTIAIGVDTDGRFFFEVAWFCWAAGIA